MRTLKNIAHPVDRVIQNYTDSLNRLGERLRGKAVTTQVYLITRVIDDVADVKKVLNDMGKQCIQLALCHLMLTSVLHHR